MYKGQYLTAQFNGVNIEGVMEVPRNAIINADEIFVIREGLLQKEKINIVRHNEKTLFFNGLNENELVVIEPLINATENTRVKVLEKR